MKVTIRQSAPQLAAVATGPLWASEPVYVKNMSPVANLFGLPAQRSAEAAAGLQAALHTSIANNYVLEIRDQEAVNFDGETIRLALTGADAAQFEIIGSELYLIAGATLNFESNPNLDVTVTVNDPALAPDPNDSASMTIGITDVNDPPTVALSNMTATLAEDTDTTSRIKVADIVITDDALGTNDLSLSGLDAGMFEIDGSELYLIAGATLNFESNPNLDVTVVVDDF